MKTQLYTSIGLPGRTVRHGAEMKKETTRTGGFSLIEMIGVLAILAISAAMLLPVLTQSTDIVLASQETTLLQSFATALQLNIQRNHVIPNATNWVSIVATELGMSSNSVAYTSRGQPRCLLVDSNGFGNLTLPYIETSSGTTNVFVTGTNFPRFIFLSSLGQPLPAVLGTNYFPTTVDFNGLWSLGVGQQPYTTPWINPVWSGKATDLTIQRLDLAYVFAHLTLSNLDPTNATYSINGSTPINLGAYGTSSNVASAYYLTATVLNLYMAHTNLEACQVLNHDSSWVYSSGLWRSTPVAAPTATNTVSGSSGSGGGSSTVSVPGCVNNDPGCCSHQFNCQSFCTNVCNPWSNRNPGDVCNDFTNYMCLYQQYAATGFTNKTCRSQLQSCANQLSSHCADLCNNNYNYNY